MIRPVLFHQAMELAEKKVTAWLPRLKNEAVLIRNLFGQIRVLLRGSAGDYEPSELKAFDEELTGALGRYAVPGSSNFIFSTDKWMPEDIFSHKDLLPLYDQGGSHLWLLERQIIGQDWTRKPIQRATSSRRATFYGVKGGVGRSTAISILAWNMAKKGKKVLLLDLDLESPGISQTLIPLNDESQPAFGIADWFIEDAIGQGESILDDLTSLSPMSHGIDGEVRLAPCYGRDTGEYMPKFTRCYMDSSGARKASWGERLIGLVEALETKYQPDVVLLDSRAGLHDIAALTITRMDADVFLFGLNSPQTWRAYSFLFQQWKRISHLNTIRNRMQIVAGLTPETDRDAYLKRFTENSWRLFSDYLYDESLPDEVGSFNFDPFDHEAPHYPIPIYWHRGLQEFEPCNSESKPDEQTISAAMGYFLMEAEKIIFSPEAVR